MSAPVDWKRVAERLRFLSQVELEDVCEDDTLTLAAKLCEAMPLVEALLDDVEQTSLPFAILDRLKARVAVVREALR